MRSSTRSLVEHAVSKVPEITLGFWIIKIAGTTLGDTGGDWLTMSLNLGYLVGSLIFLVGFVVLVSAQIRARQFYPSLYWATIVATTALGATLANFRDRSLGGGYPGGLSIVSALLIESPAIWPRRGHGFRRERRERACGMVLLDHNPVLPVGTALGDWFAGDDRGGLGLGYAAGVAIFGAGLVIVDLLWLWPRVLRTALFWAAFVLARPFGDLLDKPIAEGGVHFSRFYASGILAAAIGGCILLIPQRAARRATSAQRRGVPASVL